MAFSSFVSALFDRLEVIGFGATVIFNFWRIHGKSDTFEDMFVKGCCLIIIHGSIIFIGPLKTAIQTRESQTYDLHRSNGEDTPFKDAGRSSFAKRTRVSVAGHPSYDKDPQVSDTSQSSSSRDHDAAQASAAKDTRMSDDTRSSAADKDTRVDDAALSLYTRLVAEKKKLKRNTITNLIALPRSSSKSTSPVNLKAAANTLARDYRIEDLNWSSPGPPNRPIRVNGANVRLLFMNGSETRAVKKKGKKSKSSRSETVDKQIKRKKLVWEEKMYMSVEVGSLSMKGDGQLKLEWVKKFNWFLFRKAKLWTNIRLLLIKQKIVSKADPPM